MDADLVEAIAWWRVGKVNGRAILVRAACEALLHDDASTALAELAGVPADENPFAIDQLVERVVTDLALQEQLDTGVDHLAARRLCRALLAGDASERDVTRWVHEHFRHEGSSELMSRLAELDDEFDVAGGGVGGDTSSIAERVRAVARRVITDT